MDIIYFKIIYYTRSVYWIDCLKLHVNCNENVLVLIYIKYNQEKIAFHF